MSHPPITLRLALHTLSLTGSNGHPKPGGCKASVRRYESCAERHRRGASDERHLSRRARAVGSPATSIGPPDGHQRNATAASLSGPECRYVGDVRARSSASRSGIPMSDPEANRSVVPSGGDADNATITVALAANPRM